MIELTACVVAIAVLAIVGNWQRAPDVSVARYSAETERSLPYCCFYCISGGIVGERRSEGLRSLWRHRVRGQA